ncbi:MAG TPA: LPS assembly protein LptD [Rhizomicrobium sp.]|jgi:LPS-assembly protein
MRGKGVVGLASLLLATACASGVVLGQSGAPGRPTYSSRTVLGNTPGKMVLKADHVDYDLDTSVSSAEGHVEIDYNDRILQADRVVYDENKDSVTASGHVILMAPDGNVVFAQQMRLENQMRNGAIESFAALIGDNGRFVAARATRVGGVRTVAANAVYTPCKICNKPGQRTPDWAVKAAHVVYDELHHRISYRDAVIEFEGIPVLYTPYFSHSDPTVKHASGFLMPDVGSKSTLGYFARVPFYVALSDSQDMTFAPLVSLKGGEQLQTEYRQRWDDGGMWLQASVADDPHAGLTENVSQVYGSVFGGGNFALNNVWRTGYDAQLTSYATYLQRYGISTADRLTNDVYLEGLSGRSRFAITGYFFQGLRETDDNNLFPVVLPLIEYNYIPRTTVLGGDYRFDLVTSAISRRIGEDDQHVKADMRWRMPFVASDGELVTIQADARGDVYHTSDVNAVAITGLPNSQYVTRGAPSVALDWRWPFVSPGAFGMTGFVVQPIAQAIYAPYGDNPSSIPNETGYSVLPANASVADFQLDSTNIFDLDQFSNHDLVESGPHANVGVSGQALFPTGSIEADVGESYRLKPDPVFAPDSGYDGKDSDLVGGITVNFPHLSLSDRIDIDASADSVERNEASLDAEYGRSSIELGYVRLPSQEVVAGLGSREEVKAQALIGLWGNWVAYMAGQRDLAASKMISDQFGFGYDDECLGFSLSYERQFTEFRELQPATSIVFRFTLKTSEVPVQRSGIFPQYLYPATPL